MKKKFLLILLFLLTCTLIACGSGITVGNKTPFTTVNNFSYATMEVIEVNTDEEIITVEISYSGENELSYGEAYEIEILQDNEWYSLDSKKFTQIAIGYSVESGKSRTEDYTYARYGKLPAGHYRLVKEVHDYIEPGNYTEYFLTAEFDIE